MCSVRYKCLQGRYDSGLLVDFELWSPAVVINCSGYYGSSYGASGKGGDPAKLRDLQKARFEDPGLIDTVLDLDDQWRDGDPL